MKNMVRIDEKMQGLISGFFRERVGTRTGNPNTFGTYKTALSQFVAFVGSRNGNAAQYGSFNADMVVDFLSDYIKDPSRGIRSRNLRLAALKSLAEYAGFVYPEDLDTMSRIRSIRPIKVERKVVEHLSRNEMMALLQVAKDVSPDRYYPLFLFMYHTGTRVSEVAELKMSQLHLATGEHVIVHGKGNKYRSIPLLKDVASVIREHVRGREGDPEANVFVNRSGRAYTRNGIAFVLNDLVARAAKTEKSLAGRKISPHCIRHTTAMHLLQSGIDINTIRIWLGHVSLETTNIYVEADLKMKREAIAKAKIPILTGRTRRWNPTEDTLSFLESL